MVNVTLEPYVRANGDMLVESLGNTTDKEYFRVKNALDALQKADPKLHADLTKALTEKNGAASMGAIFKDIHSKYPHINKDLGSENFQDIARHALSGQPVKPLININGQPFSPSQIMGEVLHAHHTSTGTSHPVTSRELGIQNDIRITEPGKVTGSLVIDAENVAPKLAAHHVATASDGSHIIRRDSPLSHMQLAGITRPDVQILSHISRGAASNPLVKTILAASAAIATGAASAANAPEGERLEAGVRAAGKAAIENALPGVTESDTCKKRGEEWGYAGTAIGGGIAATVGAPTIVGAAVGVVAGGYIGGEIGSRLGEGLCNLARAATSGLSAENKSQITHKPTEHTAASHKAPDAVAAQAKAGQSQGRV